MPSCWNIIVCFNMFVVSFAVVHLLKTLPRPADSWEGNDQIFFVGNNTPHVSGFRMVVKDDICDMVIMISIRLLYLFSFSTFGMFVWVEVKNACPSLYRFYDLLMSVGYRVVCSFLSKCLPHISCICILFQSFWPYWTFVNNICTGWCMYRIRWI